MDLQFFAEKAIESQNEAQIRKGIRSLEDRVKEHRKYIGDPKTHVENWDDLSLEHQERMIEHWKTEIDTFKDNIENRKGELRRRGFNE